MNRTKILDYTKSKFYKENSDLFTYEDNCIIKLINNEIEKIENEYIFKHKGETIYNACEGIIKFPDSYIKAIKNSKINILIKTIFEKLSNIQYYFELINQILEQNEKDLKIPSQKRWCTTILSDPQFLLFYNLLKWQACFEIAKLLDSRYSQEEDDDATVFSILKEIKLTTGNHVSFSLQIYNPEHKIALTKVFKNQSLTKRKKWNKKIENILKIFFDKNIHEKLVKYYKHITLTDAKFDNELLECYSIYIYLSNYFMKAINQTLFFDDAQIKINKTQFEELFGINGTNLSNCGCGMLIQDWLVNLNRTWKNGKYYEQIQNASNCFLFLDKDKKFSREFYPKIKEKYQFEISSLNQTKLKKKIKQILISIIKNDDFASQPDATRVLVEYLLKNK